MTKRISFWSTAIIIALIFLLQSMVYAQKPYRVGTTTANFLEIGYGVRENAMGDASAAAVNDLTSVYWNPAGLGFMRQSEAMAMYQPWFVGINTSFVSIGYVKPIWGTFAVSLIYTGYSDEEVTTVDMQEGTGEMYNGQEMAFSLSYGKRLVDWFSFGASVKYINSRIWHETGQAVAFDLGAIVNTRFFAWSDKPGDGLNIGMSISNYGTRMVYNGLDLKQTKDVAPEEQGNYPYVPVRFELEDWELPLLMRLGVSAYAYKSERQRLTLALDAMHPNNNSESVNAGAEYTFVVPAYGEFSLRAGYKGLFMIDSQYGLSLGFGVKLNFLGNRALKIDYAFRDLATLGGTHSYSIGFVF
ncbi:MAG: PorV/PorQ family protein [Calditrichaeota bacterium]|nr:PorV/PorQ family protein [Calditrichota bacterium]